MRFAFVDENIEELVAKNQSMDYEKRSHQSTDPDASKMENDGEQDEESNEPSHMHSASFQMNQQEYMQLQNSNIGQTLQVVGGTNQNNQQIIQLVSPQIGSITIINNDFSQINLSQSSYKAVKTFKKTAIQKGQVEILKTAGSPLDGHSGLA